MKQLGKTAFREFRRGNGKVRQVSQSPFRKQFRSSSRSSATEASITLPPSAAQPPEHKKTPQPPGPRTNLDNCGAALTHTYSSNKNHSAWLPSGVVEGRAFFRRHRGSDRVFLEEGQHALEVFKEQVCQVLGEALADHHAHHHRILAIGREGEGGHLPAAGSQLVREVEEGIVRLGSVLDEETDGGNALSGSPVQMNSYGPSLETSSEMYLATS